MLKFSISMKLYLSKYLLITIFLFTTYAAHYFGFNYLRDILVANHDMFYLPQYGYAGLFILTFFTLLIAVPLLIANRVMSIYQKISNYYYVK
jgi:hypothetical protein